MRSVLAWLVLAACAAPAAADCSIPDRFAEHGRASRVVLVEVVGLDGMKARVRVVRVFKGSAAPAQLAFSFNPLAGESYQRRHRYLVFLGADGVPAGGCTAIEQDERNRALVEALAEWEHAARANPAVDRAAFLVRLGTRKDGVAATAALAHLAARPDLLVEVTGDEREALVRAIPSAVDERAYPLAWALARLHAVEAVPAFVAWLAMPHPAANARPVQDALELMTNHHDPTYIPGRDFYGEQAATLRAGWQRWYATHAREPREQALAAGFVERGQSPVSLTDTGPLAAILEKGSDALSCAVALDACERLARSRSTRLPTYFGGHVEWPTLAHACAPVPQP